jgi:hypothetical protein
MCECDSLGYLPTIDLSDILLLVFLIAPPPAAGQPDRAGDLRAFQRRFEPGKFCAVG